MRRLLAPLFLGAALTIPITLKRSGSSAGTIATLQGADITGSVVEFDLTGWYNTGDT